MMIKKRLLLKELNLQEKKKKRKI